MRKKSYKIFKFTAMMGGVKKRVSMKIPKSWKKPLKHGLRKKIWL